MSPLVTDHISSSRGWLLVTDSLQLTPSEFHHLHFCPFCNEWLARFADAAIGAGFNVIFVVPPLMPSEEEAEPERRRIPA